MNIAIPLGGQIRMVICSSFVIAKRKDATHYDLSGESFQLTGVTADQVYVFDDSVVITEGMELTHNLIAQSLRWIASFLSMQKRRCPMPSVCFCGWLWQTGA